MYKWMKKIHMYAGLLTFTALSVWGATGILAVFLPAPGEWQPPGISKRVEFPFEAPGNLDDKNLAKAIYDAAHLPMSGGYYNIHRDDTGNLSFIAFAVNGPRDLTYVESQRRVRIDFRDASLADFISTMHTGHSHRGQPELVSHLWGYYNEFSTWAFFFMVISGLYMWLATRPTMRWALLLAGATTAVTLTLWVTTR